MYARMHECLTSGADDRILIRSEVGSRIPRVGVGNVVRIAADFQLPNLSKMSTPMMLTSHAMSMIIMMMAMNPSGIQSGANTHSHECGNCPPIFSKAKIPVSNSMISDMSMFTRMVSLPW